jgi:hypothetical protein
MQRSALLRLAVALLVFAAIFSGVVPGLTTSAQADPGGTGACDPASCLHAGVCQFCPNGQERLCLTKVCCGVTTIISCNPCTGCALPPS